MKNVCFTFGLIIFITGQLFSQTVPDTTPTATTQPANPVGAEKPQKATDFSGGFGHFYTGVGWIEPSDLVSHLQSTEVMGSTFAWDNVAINTGIEGFAEIHRLLVGGGGFGLITQTWSRIKGWSGLDSEEDMPRLDMWSIISLDILHR